MAVSAWARPTKWRTVLLALVILMSAGSASAKADADLNARGFAEYQKGDIAAAHKLFQQAVKKQPRSPFAWLNLARTTTLLAAGREPNDPCVLEKHWVFLSLAYLDRAMAIDRVAIEAKLADASDAGLAKLKERREFAAWHIATGVIPEDDAALRGFVSARRDFWTSDGVLQSLVLGADGKARYGIPGDEQPLGAWKVRGGAVEIEAGGRLLRRYRVRAQPWAFGEGKYSYRRLVLEQDGTQDGPDTLEYGPMMDCSEG